MKTLLTLVVWVAACCSSSAMAQSWLLYAPPEGDFRVLLPAPPARGNAPEGGVEFRSEVNGERYSIFRHDPRLATAIDQARVITMRRITRDDQRPRDVGDNRTDLLPNEFEFWVGRSKTLHRIVLDSGRYYELVAQTDNEDGLSRDAARDFFNSFQLGLGLGRSFGALRNVPAPESCQARPNAYARRFCEYLTCLAPGQEGNPVCVALPRLAR